MKRNGSLFMLLAFITLSLLAAFILVTPAFAQDEVPPVEIPPEEAPSEETPDLAPALETLAESGVAVVDATGEILSLTSEETVKALSVGDPWIKVGTVTYRFLYTGESCGGDPNCTVSAQPFQDAVNKIAAGFIPSDGLIHADYAYTYPDQHIDIDGAADPDLNKIKGIVGHINADTYAPDVVLGILVGGSYIHITNMTSGAGFTLSGLRIAGSVAPVLGITNSIGPIKLTDISAQAGSIVPDSVAINISSHNGAITLNRVSASDSLVSGGALLANTLGTAGITITNSSFDSNGTGSAGGMLIYTNGPVNINGSSFSYNQTGAALNMPGLEIYQAKSVTIKNTNISGNNNAGLLAGNITGGITLENVYARQNLKNGIVIQASGNITLKNVDASWNLYDGALLDTCNGAPCAFTGTGKVTISNSHFDDNANQNSGYGGLWVGSRGAISIAGSSADRNGSPAFPGSGAVLMTTQSQLASGVTISKSEFNLNEISGLLVSARGPISLTSVNAQGNKTSYGMSLSNTSLTYGVTIKGTATAYNYISSNGNLAGTDDDGLLIATNGNISMSYVYSELNWGNGFWFVSMSPVNVTIKNSAFGYNHLNGLVISTAGTITLSGVAVDGNSGVGAMLDNLAAGSAKNVTITSSSFDDNNGGYGLFVSSKGAISLSKVSSSKNTGYGAWLDNTGGAPYYPAVKISNGTFKLNTSFGLDVDARGVVTLTNIDASGNAGIGADIENELGNVSVLSSGSSYNHFNENTGGNPGLLINTSGAVILKKTNALSNVTASGILIGSVKVPSSVSASGGYLIGNLYGMVIHSNGAISVTGVTGTGNTNAGLYLENLNDHTGTKSITVSKSSFARNGTGIGIQSWGLITLNSVTSSNNTNFGAVLENHSNTLPIPKGVNIVGSTTLSNQFNSNGLSGLVIQTCGPITISGVTADSNTNRGINLDESLTPTGGGNVTMTRVTTRYNGGNGIFVDTKGTFKGNYLTSILNSNPGLYDGLTLYAHDHAVTISNSMFIGNGYFGIYANMGAGSIAPFTLVNTFFAGNLVDQIKVVR